jgi:hypothetical protein
MEAALFNNFLCHFTGFIYFISVIIESFTLFSDLAKFNIMELWIHAID